MQQKTIPAGFTGLFPVTDASAAVVSGVRVRVDGLAGSFTPQTRVIRDGNVGTLPAPVDCIYKNFATDVSFSAGTAITVDGEYIFDTTGSVLTFNVSSMSSACTIYIEPVVGAVSVSGSGGSGGAVTGTDADNAANSTTKLPVIAGVANAAAPSWTEGHEVPLSTDLAGNLRTVSTSAAAAADNSTNSTAKTPVLPALAGTSSPSWTNGNQVPLSVDTSGNLRILSAGSAADNSTNGTAKLPILAGRANAAAPTWTEGNQVPLSADLAGNMRVIPAATEAHLGQTGGATNTVRPTVTVVAGAYSSGQNIGGKLTLTNQLRVGGPLTGTLTALKLQYHGASPPSLTVQIFRDNPSATFTDNATYPTLSVADMNLVAATINVTASDWTTVGGSSFATKVTGPITVTGVAATLYAAMAVTAAVTPPSTDALGIGVGTLND